MKSVLRLWFWSKSRAKSANPTRHPSKSSFKKKPLGGCSGCRWQLKSINRTRHSLNNVGLVVKIGNPHETFFNNAVAGRPGASNMLCLAVFALMFALPKLIFVDRGVVT